MKSVLKLLPVIAARPGLFLEAIVWNVLSALLTLGIALGLSYAVGHALAGELTGLSGLVAALCAAGVLGALLAWRESWVSHDLAYRIIGVLRARAFAVLARILPERRRPRRSGDLATTVLGDIETLEWLYAHTVAQLLGAGLVLGTGVVLSLQISGWLLLVWVPLLILASLLPWLTARRASADGARLAAGAARLRADLVDTVRGLRELSGAGALERQWDSLTGDTRALARIQLREASRVGAERAAGELLIGLSVLGTILVVLAQRSGIAAADIPLAIAIAVAGISPAAQISDLLRNTGTLRAAAERIAQLLDSAAPESAEIFPDLAAPARPGEQGLVFEQVGFGYTAGLPVLKDFNLRLAPGEILALTGVSGSGKSTVARLALRLWDPDSGSIRLDGADLRGLDERDLRAGISVVPQSSPVLRGTIRSNIVLGDPQASAAQVEAAARDAGLLEAHAGLPLGLDTVLGEHGSGVSGGQRARIAIARALLRNPKVLILDEATASLDPDADQAIMALLKKPTRRATLLIAHRPDTIAAAHRVVSLHALAQPRDA
ncbi:ABC transporter ATP-binding protein [Glutamicibacter sp. AOP38-B1-38]|uniref:ABC transporter ATP-binding protein n=1 Tax=Glutamicibacter sp. AOP38-B1-38 TaxID=3457680 RepID=UPI0040333EAF